MSITLLIYTGFATIVISIISFIIALIGWFEKENHKDMFSMVGWATAFVWSIIAVHLLMS